LSEVTRPSHQVEMTVMVERRPDAGDTDCEAAARTLVGRIKDLIGISITVDLKPAGALDRSQGKARRVIDRRSRN